MGSGRSRGSTARRMVRLGNSLVRGWFRGHIRLMRPGPLSLFLFLLALPACGGEDAAPPEEHRLTGFVGIALSAEETLPVAGVEVGVDYRSLAGTTDASGNYSIGELRDGEYQLTAAGTGETCANRDWGHVLPLEFMETCVIPVSRTVQVAGADQGVDIQMGTARKRVDFSLVEVGDAPSFSFDYLVTLHADPISTQTDEVAAGGTSVIFFQYYTWQEVVGYEYPFPDELGAATHLAEIWFTIVPDDEDFFGIAGDGCEDRRKLFELARDGYVDVLVNGEIVDDADIEESTWGRARFSGSNLLLSTLGPVIYEVEIEVRWNATIVPC